MGFLGELVLEKLKDYGEWPLRVTKIIIVSYSCHQLIEVGRGSGRLGLGVAVYVRQRGCRVTQCTP
jgi:hypothetical protein